MGKAGGNVVSDGSYDASFVYDAYGGGTPIGSVPEPARRVLFGLGFAHRC